MCAPVAQIVVSSAAITGHYHSHRVLLLHPRNFVLSSSMSFVYESALSSSMVVCYLDEMFLVHSKVCDRSTCVAVPFLANVPQRIVMMSIPSSIDTPHDDHWTVKKYYFHWILISSCERMSMSGTSMHETQIEIVIIDGHSIGLLYCSALVDVDGRCR